MALRILGIDPGYAIVGLGVIDYIGNNFKPIKYDKIETKANTPLPERLATIYNILNVWILDTKPDVVAIEQLFFNTNTKTAFSVAQARGVIILACHLNNIPIYEYTPLQVKQAVVGYGKAEKLQVQKMVKTLLNLEKIPKPDDIADALAVAICHANNAATIAYTKYI
jgi:crossover junction endodeoxyribonuclease RuvC